MAEDEMFPCGGLSESDGLGGMVEPLHGICA